MPLKRPQRYLSTSEPYLNVDGKGFYGINLDSEHNILAPGEFRVLDNFDLFENYIKTRRGMRPLDSVGVLEVDCTVLNGLVANLNGTEWIFLAILYQGDTLITYKTLTSNDSFQYLKYLDDSDENVIWEDSSVIPDMIVSNDQIYIFHELGNHIVRYDEDATNFRGRKLGLPKCYIYSHGTNPGGTMTGTYCLAVETVYKVDGLVVSASTPNRKEGGTGGNIVVTTNGDEVIIVVDGSSLPSSLGEDYWTHVKVYMSRNLDRTETSPGNFTGPYGLENELYAVMEVDRATLEGNTYSITLNVNDDAIDTTDIYEIDRIELDLLPNGNLGAYHKNRIYVGDGENKTTLFYSNFAGDEYSELYNPGNVIKVEPGDGQAITKLISYNNNLIVFKTGKTFVLQNGNVDLPPDVIDNNVGVSHKKLVNYVTKLGIVAITSDNLDIKLLTTGLQWTNVVNKRQISNINSKLREYVANANILSMVYINEKLIICNGENECLVYHAGQGKGWSTYTYPTQDMQIVYNFGQGQRVGFCAPGDFPYEIEVHNQYEDDIDGETQPIEQNITTWQFQNNNGLDLIEFSRLKISATLDNYIFTGTAIVNEEPWYNVVDTEGKPHPDYLQDTERTRVYEFGLRYRPTAPYICFEFIFTGNNLITNIKMDAMIMNEMTLNSVTRLPVAHAPVIIVQPEDVEVEI